MHAPIGGPVQKELCSQREVDNGHNHRETIMVLWHKLSALADAVVEWHMDGSSSDKPAPFDVNTLVRSQWYIALRGEIGLHVGHSLFEPLEPGQFIDAIIRGALNT